MSRPEFDLLFDVSTSAFQVDFQNFWRFHGIS